MADTPDQTVPARTAVAPRMTQLLDPETGEPYVGRRGRPSGALDLVNADMRALIRASLDDLDPVRYLTALAQSEVPSDRTAYVGLLSRTIPTEIKGSVGGNFVLEVVNYAALQQQQQQADAARTIDMPVHSALLD